MRLRHSLYLMGPLLFGTLTGCGEGLDTAPGSDAPAIEAPASEQLGTVESAAVSTAGLTTHFRSWLSANGYSADNFARTDLVGGSFGGKESSTDTVVNTPVIFIHGNSDKAVGTGTAGQSGWNNSIEYFLANGYKSSELYATTWGPADIMQTANQYHSKPNIMHVRRFIEAVKAYTGKSKVHVIAHSMGVTLARKAILGGSANDSLNGGSYDVGASLTSSVDTFVGIAGANLGLTSCYLTGPSTPTCGATNGLYPGYLFGGVVLGRSAFLDNLRSKSGYEGSYRYSIFSTADEIIGYGGVVYGSYTSRIPGQTGEKVYDAYPYGHYNSKDLTAAVQLSMVKYHTIP
ncbi:lipase family protein [Myxococcus stipitatus]|uniref:lipase family protein n=1 Tax=Myxococcus stipitatus TaxID=83455 RepID=UPI001F41BB20|nr:lipase family protein [Myxococcus stipitatus]MCE9668711.1 lipase family protein [Myxococcus stipitatus]